MKKYTTKFKEFSVRHRNTRQDYEDLLNTDQVNMRNEIIRMRDEMGLSLRIFAEVLKISPAYLSDIENGRRNVSDAIMDTVNNLEN